MSIIENGGPAFPQISEIGDICYTNNGMTIRDYFAAKAMPLAYKFWMEDFYHPDSVNKVEGLEYERTDFEDNISLIAESCYEMADAMLKAREINFKAREEDE